MDLKELDNRKKSLMTAHKQISATILMKQEELEGLMNHRLKIAGAIEEINYVEKHTDKEDEN